MRLDQARLAPLTDDELDVDQAALLAPFRAQGRDYAIFRTFARHPAALKAFLGWGGHVLSDRNTLSPRQRELLILRTGWRCRAGYEWARHVPIGRRAGLSEDEIAALKRPVEDGDWDAADAVLVAVADALVADFFVPDALWAQLAAAFDPRQCMDVLFTVGQYAMVSMFLNSAGVQLDDDVTLDPDLDARA